MSMSVSISDEYSGYERLIFKELKERLDELECKHKISIDKLMELLYKVSGDIRELRDYLEGKMIVLWTPLEDSVIQHVAQDNLAYKYLEDAKGGPHVVKKRVLFLMFSTHIHISN